MVCKVLRIEEDIDFGCEELNENAAVMALVILDAGGETFKIRYEDALLYKKNINPGDYVFISESGKMERVLHIYAVDDKDCIYVAEKGILFEAAEPKHGISTSALNGGVRHELRCAFNYDEKDPETGLSMMEERTYEEHLKNISSGYFGTDPSGVTGLSTSAQMKNAVFETDQYQSQSGEWVHVSVLATGGIDKNGARAGDPTYWMEEDGVFYPWEPSDEVNAGKLDKSGNEDDAPTLSEANNKKGILNSYGSLMSGWQKDNWQPSGTINILVYVDANMTDTALVKALVTVTEAKTAAVLDLGCKSLYSDHMATGSGTDGTIILSDPKGKVRLTTASTDCKLGEILGKCVYKAVKSAIIKQMGWKVKD